MKLLSIFRKKSDLPDPLDPEYNDIATCARCPVKENGKCPFPTGCTSFHNVAEKRRKALRAARGVDDDGSALASVAKCLKGTIIKREYNSKCVSFMITDVDVSGTVSVHEKVRYTKSGKIWTNRFTVCAPILLTATGVKMIDIAELWKAIIHHDEIWRPGKK